MVPLLRMPECQNLSLGDAEAAGSRGLSEAAKRCQRCIDSAACIHWLKWRGRHGRAPLCLNAAYFAELRKRAAPG